MEAILNSNTRTRIIFLDILVIVAIFLIPSIAFFSPFPLYYAEPNNLIAIVLFFITRNHWNAVAFAFTIPLFSMLFTEHPIPLNALLISVELFVKILVIKLLIRKFNSNL